MIVEDLSNADCLVVPKEVYRQVAEFLKADAELDCPRRLARCWWSARGR